MIVRLEAHYFLLTFQNSKVIIEGNRIERFDALEIQNKRRSEMAYKITDACAACGTCAGECPVGAISEGDIYVIDQDACAQCGTCASVCPVGAIIEE